MKFGFNGQLMTATSVSCGAYRRGAAAAAAADADRSAFSIMHID